MQKHNPVRPTTGATPVAIDARKLLWRYRLQFAMIVGAACALEVFQLLRLLFS